MVNVFHAEEVFTMTKKGRVNANTVNGDITVQRKVWLFKLLALLDHSLQYTQKLWVPLNVFCAIMGVIRMKRVNQFVNDALKIITAQTKEWHILFHALLAHTLGMAIQVMLVIFVLQDII